MYHTKEVIEQAFNKLKEDLEVSSFSFLGCMSVLSDIKELKGEFKFYEQISQDIMQGNENDLSIEEKDHFLKIHSDCVKYINGNKIK